MKKIAALVFAAAVLLYTGIFMYAASLAHINLSAHAAATKTIDPAMYPYGITILGSQFTRTTLGPGGTTLPPANFSTLGVTWARVQIHMTDLFSTDSPSPDPAVPTNYTWTLLDQALMNAQSNRLLVDFPLQGVPNGSYNNQPFKDSCNHPTAYVFKAYVTALMGHLRDDLFVTHPEVQGTIRAIEIGNEDWSFSSNSDPSCENNPTVYAQIVERVAPQLRNVSAAFMSPTPLIGSFGYTHFAMMNDAVSQRSVSYFWGNFYKDLGNPASHLDFVNFHYYHDNLSPDNIIPPGYDNNTYPRGQDTFKNVYKAIQAAGRGHVSHSGEAMPIWLTETGWTTSNCLQNNIPVPQSTQSAFEQKMLNEARYSNNLKESNGGVTHLFLFTADQYAPICGYNGMAISYDGVWQPAAIMLHSYIGNHPTWP